MLLNGTRRGVGTHNAIFVPARTLFSLELGRQGTGLAAGMPDGTQVRLPEGPRQLRVREAAAIGELTSLFEAAQREDAGGRALSQDALDAHVALMSVWLRRQITLPENLPIQMNAAARLSAAFCQRVALLHATGLSMADPRAQSRNRAHGGGPADGAGSLCGSCRAQRNGCGHSGHRPSSWVWLGRILHPVHPAAHRKNADCFAQIRIALTHARDARFLVARAAMSQTGWFYVAKVPQFLDSPR